MTKQTFDSVGDYIASQPPSAREALEEVRRAIRAAVPDADEMVLYNMPSYALRGRTFLSVAAWKDHFALYGASAPVVEAFGNELAGCRIEKGTIAFPLAAPVNQSLIARIAAFRAGLSDERGVQK